jgi:hypothetical protein
VEQPQHGEVVAADAFVALELLRDLGGPRDDVFARTATKRTGGPSPVTQSSST